MPRYFFDIYDGSDVNSDQNGTELDDDSSARLEATRTLSAIAAQELPGDGHFRQFHIIVHDETRKVLFEVWLDFSTKLPD